MSNRIHPTAIIDPSAVLGETVEIGPYAVIGADVEVGDGTQIGPHVVIEPYSIIGRNCKISAGAVLGGLPQDLGFKGEVSRIRVGDNTHIRECVTINRATGEGKETVVGANCMLMAYSHLGHNCQLGDNVILANSVQLGGYVEIGDYAFIGGASVVHQFVKIGRIAILGGFSASRQDIPPFVMADNRPASIRGINTIGLRRRGFSSEERQRLKQAVFYLWFSGLNLTHAIETLEDNMEIDDNVRELIGFVKQQSKRGIITGPTRFRRTNSLSGSAESEFDTEPVGGEV